MVRHRGITRTSGMNNPELDRQVAEEVCGWKPSGLPWRIPAFSTDHNAFFQYVVPAMRHIGVYFVWEEIHHRAKFMLHGDKLIGEHMEKGFTPLPRAGCLAALEAVRAMKGDN